jgi:chorismate mutase
MITIEQLREQIKQTDVNIIELLAKRQELSKQIGQLKLTQGKAIIDLSREKTLFDFYEKLSEHYKLQQSFVKRIFKIIISYSRMVQKS